MPMAKFNIKSFIQFVIIFLFGVYIRYLIITKGIAFYVNPRYFNLIDASGIVAVFVGLLGIVLEISKIKGGLKIKNYKLKIDRLVQFTISNALIVICIIIGFVLPPKQLSTRAASNRTSNAQATFDDNSDNIINSFMRSYDTYDIADWLKSFNREPDLTLYENIEVTVKGFVFESDDLAEDEFLIGRFVIRCCVVDATPVGLVVKMTDWKTKYKDGQWLQVKGNFKIFNNNDSNKLYIEPVEINLIETPDNPYIY